MTYPAAHHQGVTEVLWLHYRGALIQFYIQSMMKHEGDFKLSFYVFYKDK